MTYTIHVYTTETRGAGTIANVFIDVHGDKAFSGKVLLENAADNFTRGKHDVFELTCRELGDIKEVVLGHDGGMTSSELAWHCNQVRLCARCTS